MISIFYRDPARPDRDHVLPIVHALAVRKLLLQFRVVISPFPGKGVAASLVAYS
jgi:hypothetical protein